MVQLRNGEAAIIDRRKFAEYALNIEHDDGKHKAKLFHDILGITNDNVDLLVEALKKLAVTAEALEGKKDHYGERYTIDFHFEGPSGHARLRSAWIIRTGEHTRRLVTCYVL